MDIHPPNYCKYQRSRAQRNPIHRLSRKSKVSSCQKGELRLITNGQLRLGRYGRRSPLYFYVVVDLLRRYVVHLGKKADWGKTLPATGLLVGLAVVARDFDMSQGETAWISTAISLSSGSFLLLGGRLADLYGRKLILVISFTISAIGSIIAGLAKSKYKTIPQKLNLMQGTCFLWREDFKDWLRLVQFPRLLVSWERITDLGDARIESLRRFPPGIQSARHLD